MIFAKVDVTLPSHHRMLKIPRGDRAACLGVWLAALCYSRGAELDGLCPAEALDVLAPERAITLLVSVGLFASKTVDGVRYVEVLKYAEHNETKAEIANRVKATKKRVSEFRKRARSRNTIGNALQVRISNENVPGSGSDSGSDSDLFSLSPSSTSLSGSPQPVTGIQPVAKATNENADGCFGNAVRAFGAGISRATGKPFSAPRYGTELDKLVQAMRVHCPDVAEREAWMAKQAERFGRESKTRLSVHAFVDWLNSPASAPKPVDRMEYNEKQRDADGVERWYHVVLEDGAVVRREPISMGATG